MKPELELLKASAEAIPERAEKDEMLKALAETRREDQVFQEITQRMQSENSRSDLRAWRERVFVTVMTIFIAYFPISAVVKGRISMSFESNSPDVFWKSDPYLFGVLVFLYSIPTFLILGALVRDALFKRKLRLTLVRMRAESTSTLDYVRRMRESLAQQGRILEEERASIPAKRPGAPLWLVVLVIGSFVAIIVRAIIRAS